MTFRTIFHQLSIRDRHCIIVHAGYIETVAGVPTKKTYASIEEFYLYAREDAYLYGGISHGMVIAGHTPTIAEKELPFNHGNVYRFYDAQKDCVFYDIDCGCSYAGIRENAKLACIRLEDEKIFYA